MLHLGMLLMGGIGLLLAAFPEYWLSVFMKGSQETVALAVAPLVLMGLVQAVDAVGVVMGGLLVGVGDTRAMLAISVVCQWGLFLPVAWALALPWGGGLMGLWGSMAGYRVVLAVVVALRYHRGRWALAKV